MIVVHEYEGHDVGAHGGDLIACDMVSSRMGGRCIDSIA